MEDNHKEKLDDPGSFEEPIQSETTLINKKRRQQWLIVAAVIVAVIAALGLFLWRGSTKNSGAGRPVPEPTDNEPSSTNQASGKTTIRPEDMIITLPLDKVENAGIKTDVAIAAQTTTSAPVTGGLRTTGTVESNQYR